MNTKDIKANFQKWISESVELKFTSNRVLSVVSLREYCSRIAGRPFSLKESKESFYFTIKNTKAESFDTMMKLIGKGLLSEDVEFEVDKDKTESEAELLRNTPEWMRYQVEFFQNLLDTYNLEEEQVDPYEFFKLGSFFYELAVKILHRFPSLSEFKKFIGERGYVLSPQNEANTKRFYTFMRIVG